MPTLRHIRSSQAPLESGRDSRHPGVRACDRPAVRVDEQDRLQLAVRTAARAMAPARVAVRAWCARSPDAPADALALLATELLTNAYLSGGPTAECLLELNRPSGGRGWLLRLDDPHPALPTRRRLGLWDEEGRTLRVVDALARHWSAEPHGTGKRFLVEVEAEVPAPESASTGDGAPESGPRTVA